MPLGAIMHLLPPNLDLTDPPAAFLKAAQYFTEKNTRNNSKSQRQVLMIDDLQNLDATSVAFVIGLLELEVIFLIGTLRTEEGIAETPAYELIHGQRIMRVDLRALDVEETNELLVKVLKGSIEKRSVYELHQASEGNPLILREILIGTLESGGLEQSSLPGSDHPIWHLKVPALHTTHLTELVESRLVGLKPEVRKLVQALAICETMSMDELLAHGFSLGSVADAENSQIAVVHTSRRRTHVSLAHPIYGEAIRRKLPRSLSSEILLRQIEIIDAKGARRREDALRLAGWNLSATGKAPPELLLSGAKIARHSHDYVQARIMLDAIQEESHTITSLLMLGEVLYLLGEHEEAEKTLQRAHADANSEDESLAVALERSNNLFWAAADTEKALTINNSERGRQTQHPLNKMALNINEGHMLTVSGQPVRGLELLAGVDHFPDPRVRVPGLAMKASALAMTGRTDDAVRMARATYEEFLENSPERITTFSHPAAQIPPLVYALSENGNLREACRLGEEASRQGVRAGIITPNIWITYFIGRSYLLAGRLQSAREWFAEAISLGQRHHQMRVFELAYSGIAAASAQLRDIKSASAAAEAAQQSPRTGLLKGEERLGEAWTHAAKGNLTAAREVLGRAAEAARQAQQVTSESLLLGEAVRVGGATECLERLTQVAEACDGRFAEARRIHARAAAERDAEALRSASSEFEKIGAVLQAAEAANAAAELFRAAGEKRSAAASDRLVDRLRSECQGALTPGLIGNHRGEVLTAREKEIALLAAQGVTSKEIAASLVLSVRTVDNHIQRVYGKLGVKSRKELAASLGLE
jgi:DNA-binding CsgD family transcriptional regulator